MSLSNCRKCGKMFNHIGGPMLCESCRKKMEDSFQQVRKYLYDNPGSSLEDIAKNNDVSIGQINEWIRQERLVFSENSPIKIKCEKCGATILTGRFCAKCKNDIAKEMRGNSQKDSGQSKTVVKRRDANGEMRYLH